MPTRTEMRSTRLSGSVIQWKMNAIRAILLASLGLVLFSHAGQVLIHSGPVVTSPDAILLDPLNPDQKGKDLTFIYEFFADSNVIERLAAVSSEAAAISATKAIELAERTVEPRKRREDQPSIEPKLLKYKEGSVVIRYYVICVRVDDGSETHRVVLMDGTILKPQLKKISNGK